MAPDAHFYGAGPFVERGWEGGFDLVDARVEASIGGGDDGCYLFEVFRRRGVGSPGLGRGTGPRWRLCVAFLLDVF